MFGTDYTVKKQVGTDYTDFAVKTPIPIALNRVIREIRAKIVSV